MYNDLFQVNRERRFFNKTDALNAFGIGLLAMQAGGLLLLFFAGETVALFTVQLAGLIFFFTYTYVKKINLKSAMVFNKLKLINIPVLALMSISLMFVSLPFLNLISEFLESIGYSFSEAAEYSSVFSEIAAILVISIMPALCEEFLFRGIIMRGLQYKGKWFSIIITALLFTLMHGNPEQTLHPLIIGTVMGFAVYQTGSLLASIVMHFCNNLFAMLLELYFWNGFFEQNLWLCSLAALVIFSGALTLLIKLNKKTPSEYGSDVPVSAQLAANLDRYNQACILLPREVYDHHRHACWFSFNRERSGRNAAAAWFWVAFALCALNWIILFFGGLLI